MTNIKLTTKQYNSVVGSLDNVGFVLGANLMPNLVPRIFGCPLYPIDGGFLVYLSCEFCGKFTCKCGAPLDWQGKFLAMGEEDGHRILDVLLTEIIRQRGKT